MANQRTPSIALILGSGPSALKLKDWPKPDNLKIIAINNAWAAHPDWDYLVHAGDFPVSRMPERLAPLQSVHSHESYVPAQNRYGGFVYGGGTMAYTAGYWALDTIVPDILAYFACDMTYSGTMTHFYGNGTADPLRPDVTLQSLEAKSARLMALAGMQGCACVNLSAEPATRLMFPRVKFADLTRPVEAVATNPELVEAALLEEARLGYMVEDGEYWRHTESFDAGALSRIDEMWLSTCLPQQLQKRFA
jgi:hypothetical protein